MDFLTIKRKTRDAVALYEVKVEGRQAVVKPLNVRGDERYVGLLFNAPRDTEVFNIKEEVFLTVEEFVEDCLNFKVCYEKVSAVEQNKLRKKVAKELSPEYPIITRIKYLFKRVGRLLRGFP